MALPIIAGAAAAVAARLAAKKAAQELTKKAVKKTAAKVVSKNVKVKPGRTASGLGLETRGNKITTASQKAAAKKLIKDDQLRTMNSPSMNYIDSTFRGPSLKTLKRNAPVKRAADKKLPIQINSAPKKTADSAKAANAKALKAANKPVSKGNRNIGGPVVRNIIKNSPPARANRTRLGNPAKKK